MRVSRADQSAVARWWFTVDHTLLAAVLAIVAAGVVLSLAASPSVAVAKGLPAYYFVERHIVFSLAGVAVMFAVSFLDPQKVRRLSLLLFLFAICALVYVVWDGTEINGAKRWMLILGHSFQPSEIAKPAFVVVTAWLFAEATQAKDMPALPLAIGLAIILCVLLVLQPDVGQTVLVSAVWSALYFVSGQPVLGGIIIMFVGVIGLIVGYAVFPHVQYRIDKFLYPNPGDNSQVDRAMQSFTEGGFFGRGPGEGTIKTVLPDAHTDFIFAVVAEEYGVIACLALLLAFTFIVLRAFGRARQESDLSIRYAIVGLALLFALQAYINMAVNIGLLPAKGMTLPFISAGGSSMLAVSLTVGMLLALTRRRPSLAHLHVPTVDAQTMPAQRMTS